MSLITFIAHIKKLFPESSWPWLLAALNNDTQVWQSLDGSLGERALERNSSRPEDYSPAALALLALDCPLDLDEVRNGAAVAWDETHLSQISSLGQAGQTALRLRSQLKHALAWEDLASLAQPQSQTPTVLACLYGMLPNPAEMLRAVAALESADDSRLGLNLALHALFSNPLPPQAYQEALIELLTDLPRRQRFNLLRLVNARRPDLAAPLSQALLDLEQNLNGRGSNTLEQGDSLFGEIHRLLQLAELQRLSPQPQQAIPLLERALSQVEGLQAHLAGQMAQTYASIGDQRAAMLAWERANALDPHNPNYLSELVLALAQAGSKDQAISLLASQSLDSAHPALWLARARLLWLEGQPQEAHAAARRAFEGIGELTARQTADLAALLFELRLSDEAIQAAERTLAIQPLQVEMLALKARAHQERGESRSAALAAHLATAFAPNRLDLRRLLAECLEEAGDCAAALAERQTLMERTPAPTEGDWRALAVCALRAAQPQQALQACQVLLSRDENDPLALSLAGQACLESKDEATALEYLQRALMLAPDQPAPWLGLANLHHRSGQPQKALESLQAAAHACPGAAEISLALGEAYLSQGAITQALSALREAHQLVSRLTTSPRSIEYSLFWPQELVQRRRLSAHVALRLGQTLIQSGYLAEARRILEQAYQQAASDAEIAQSYAQALLALGENHLALEPLETVMHSHPQDISPYLDYARSLLALNQDKKGGYPVEKALQALQHVLEHSPNHPEATALLAEALAVHNDLLPAMEAYHQALESPLAQDPAWQARLSLGLGEVACKLGQIETAIAALQEASQADPTNPRIQRSLSEAYDAAGLSEDAYQAARAALLLAPSDVDNLTWFVAQALNLKERPGLSVPEIQAEVINALERAIQLSPQRSDLWVTLGQIQLKAGNQPAALNAFRKLAEADDPAPYCTTLDLYQAAQGLLQLGDPAAAARCLERALQSGAERETSASPRLLDLLVRLAQARRQAGDRLGALEALDQALTLAPNETDLYLDKADLLLELSGPQASPEILSCLTTALKLNPGQPTLHYRAALIRRAAGDLPMAWMHAVQMVENSGSSPSLAMQARALAADLALAILQPGLARLYLEEPLPPPAPNSAIDEAILLDYHALRAELALEEGDERLAIEALARVLDIAPEGPRLLAIQARLALSNDPQAALSAFESTLKALGEPGQAPLSALYASAEAALELGQWEVGLRLCESLTQRAPLEPRSHLTLARLLVLRAEYQDLTAALDVIRNAPGPQALSEGAREQFENCLQKASRLIENWNERSLLNASISLLERWRLRGQAIFQPSPANAQALATLPPQADDVAARVACLRRLGDLSAAALAARDYPQSPLVLLQLALSLAEEKPRQAMAAIRAAADALERFTPRAARRSAFNEQQIAPLIHALMARLFHRNGNRASDRHSALQAIQEALSLWPDEPRWHTLAAEIYLRGNSIPVKETPNTPSPDLQGDTQTDIDTAIAHLQKAIQLDPGYAPSLLLLGHISLQSGHISQAIQAFEQATQVAGDQAEAWMALAQAYRSAGNLEGAASCAERAVTLAPNQIAPLLLRGEIALESENPRGAQSRAQAALRIQPDHPAALLLMARALNALDHPEEALALLEKALPLTTEPLSLSLERVRLLRRYRGVEPALQAARHLAERYGDEPGVLSVLADLLEASGQDEVAIHTAQRALRSPECADKLSRAEQAHLHFLLGRLFHRAGQLDQAVHHLNECLQLAPEKVEAYLELGQVHQERRQYNQALNVYRQAISVVPNDHRPYYQVGLALKESKDYLGAEKMLRRAAELAPNDPAIHRLLAAVVALNLVHNRREAARQARF